MNWLSNLRANESGSVVIETAFVAPILAILGFGAFEASMLVSRHNELQVAAAEAAAIVLARPPEDQTARNTIEGIVESSTGLAADKVSFALKYRCNANTTLVNSDTACGSSDVISEYIVVTMTDSADTAAMAAGPGPSVSR